jgi:hypothetical protein
MNKISSAESSRLTVTYRPLGDLIPDPRNARTHPKRQIDQIRASIEAFGFTNPVLADPEGHIIAGHGRLQAARAMGLTELPVITLSGLSETQKRTLRIADNKIALNAGWDLEILHLELGELGSIDVDIDLALTGFSTGEIDVILTSAVDPDDEVIPPVPATPRTKPGDIWILGEHRVGCGDGRDAEFLQRVIGHGRRSACFARWRRPLRLHGLATHGRLPQRRKMPPRARKPLPSFSSTLNVGGRAPRLSGQVAERCSVKNTATRRSFTAPARAKTLRLDITCFMRANRHFEPTANTRVQTCQINCTDPIIDT